MKDNNKPNYTMVLDSYEPTMSDVLFDIEKNSEGVFDIFYRSVPNGGGYTIMAGLDKVIDFVKNIKFTDEDIEHFKEFNYNFSDEYLEYLRNFKFTGDIYAVPDGTPVFPNEPIMTIKAPSYEVELLETSILAIINGAMSHSTAARRIVEAKPKNVKLMEFGARRADGQEAANDTSRYAIMAGCDGTSNLYVAKELGIKAMGTMAHLLVQYLEGKDNEYNAFVSFVKKHPECATLLVDTNDTLKIGVPNAIKTFDYMKKNGISLDNIGIRIDSGDLAYLSKEARKMLNEAGYPNAKICLSNALSAETIESLVAQKACFDSIGVGDNISKPLGNIGCVYKLVAVIKNGIVIPKIKISNDVIKTTNPDFKDLYRAYDKETGYAIADIMCSRGDKMPNRKMKIISVNDLITNTTIDNYRLVKLQKTIFKNGNLVYEDPSLFEKREYCEKQMQTLYPEVKRTLNPHKYYVDGTQDYINLKSEMILSHKK